MDEESTLPTKNDFSGWYNELLWRAEIMDVRYPVKGLYVWFPFGFSLRKHTYAILREIMDRDHQETLFPLLIPEPEFMKEAEHIKGFEEEVYWVTHGGTSPLDVPLALRPTSETAIYPMYALWIRSHADLPLRLYQIVNTFRYETKHTRPLIRLREITSFKEAHTVHATWEDAEKQVQEAVRLYQEFYHRLSIPILISRRPDWDKFPGADYTLAVDTVMPDGRTLQIGTVHHLGDHFSRTFSISYESEEGEQKLAFQTCYGISERSIAALICVHGDDRGLALPPPVAPTQVVIVPITIGKRKDDVTGAAKQVAEDLSGAGFRVRYDDRNLRPGAKYYYWELRGVPVRVEIGPRDLDAGVLTAVTRLGEKTSIPISGCIEGIRDLLHRVGGAMAEKAANTMQASIRACVSVDEVQDALLTGVAVVSWCGDRACATELETRTDSSVLGTGVVSPYTCRTDGPCIICGKTGDSALVGRSY